MEYKSNRGPQKKCENAIYNLPDNNDVRHVRRLYFQIVLFITHSHTHICVFYYYYEIDSKLSVQMCGWPCEYVCV